MAVSYPRDSVLQSTGDKYMDFSIQIDFVKTKLGFHYHLIGVTIAF